MHHRGFVVCEFAMTETSDGGKLLFSQAAIYVKEQEGVGQGHSGLLAHFQDIVSFWV